MLARPWHMCWPLVPCTWEVPQNKVIVLTSGQEEVAGCPENLALS